MSERNGKPSAEDVQHRRDTEDLMTISAVAAIGLIAFMGIKAATRSHDKPYSPPAPVEQQGNYHSSNGMTSEQHLKQFTHEHGIRLRPQ